jgi:hypothetical protein
MVPIQRQRSKVFIIIPNLTPTRVRIEALLRILSILRATSLIGLIPPGLYPLFARPHTNCYVLRAEYSNTRSSSSILMELLQLLIPYFSTNFFVTLLTSSHVFSICWSDSFGRSERPSGRFPRPVRRFRTFHMRRSGGHSVII